MNFEKARFNMVEQQIRPWDVLNQQVLDLLSIVPRENFVPTLYRKLAYSDTAVPLSHGEVMLVPREVGRMLQALEINSSDLILEIGTGSGYVTALLAKLAAHVLSVEIDDDLHDLAGKNLAEEGVTNVTLVNGDAAKGWDQKGPYNVIVITGSLPLLPDSFKNSLHIGGRLFAIIGQEPNMEAILITRLGHDQWRQTSLFETVVPPLRNAKYPSAFVF